MDIQIWLYLIFCSSKTFTVGEKVFELRSVSSPLITMDRLLEEKGVRPATKDELETFAKKYCPQRCPCAIYGAAPKEELPLFDNHASIYKINGDGNVVRGGQSWDGQFIPSGTSVLFVQES